VKQLTPKILKVLKRPYNRGFSLAEILLAVAILAFAFCGILAMHTTCLVLMATSKNVNIATNAAQGLIEEIRSTPFTQIISDYNGLNFIVNNIPSSRGVVYVDDTDPELLEVTISVCWKQGKRIIGEDTNLNGVLDSGEDKSPYNQIIDSPVELVTRIANR
jgi:prepilin-type N-terminal cleavage/methylation domain-containing protein